VSTSTALYIKDPVEISHPDMGLVVVAGEGKLGFMHSLDERTWLASVSFASRTISNLQFTLGDLMLRGEEAFGEDAYAKAAEASSRDAETLRHYAWVAKRVPEFVRNPALSFNHHRQVATLGSEGEQMLWLARAEAEGLSVIGLKDAIHAARPIKQRPDTSSAALADTLNFVEKRMATLGTGDEPKIFLCQLIQELEDKLNTLDGVVCTTNGVGETNEFDTAGTAGQP